MRRGIIGSARDGGRRNIVAGAAWQRILWEQLFTQIGNARNPDRWGLPFGAIDDFLIVDWADGDGLYPDVGPSPLLEVGSPSYGLPTPWVLYDGTPITCMGLDGVADGLRHLTSIDPAANEDIIFWFACRAAIPAASAVVVSTRSGGNDGISVQYQTELRGVVEDALGTQETASVPGITLGYGSWTMAFHAIDHSDLATGQRLIGPFRTGLSVGAVPAGVLGGAYGFGIGVSPTLGRYFGGDIARVKIWKGVGAADFVTDDMVDAVSASLLGIAPSNGPSEVTYARAASQIYPVGTRLHILADNVPPAGSAEGRAKEDAVTSKTYRNCHHEAGDAAALFTVEAGLTLTDVDDSTELATVGLRELGALVIRFQNSAGGVRKMRYGATMGGLVAGWPSARTRVVSGGADVGLWDGTNWTKGADCAADYSRSTAKATAVHADQQWGLEVEDGSDGYLILGCLSTGDEKPSEVMNLQAAAIATVDEGVLTLPAALVLDDTGGRIECDLTPDGFSTTERGGTDRVVNRDAVDTDIAKVSDANTRLEAGDGTATATATITEADGTEYTARWSWGDRGLRVDEVGGNNGAAAYDDALTGAGDLELGGIGRKMKNLRILSNQGGKP